jgi:hypothetical protein
MRDVEVTESEPRLLAAVRRTGAEVGARAPRIGPVDELLDSSRETPHLCFIWLRIPHGCLDLDHAIEALVSAALCVAFLSLGDCPRIALCFCSPALEGLAPTVHRSGSAVERRAGVGG